MSNVTAPNFTLWYLLHCLPLESGMKTESLGVTAKRNLKLEPYFNFEYTNTLICIMDVIFFSHFGSVLQIHIILSNRLGPYIIFEYTNTLICIMDVIFFSHFGSVLQIHILHSNRLGPCIIFEDAAILIYILPRFNLFHSGSVLLFHIPHNDGK